GGCNHIDAGDVLHSRFQGHDGLRLTAPELIRVFSGATAYRKGAGAPEKRSLLLCSIALTGKVIRAAMTIIAHMAVRRERVWQRCGNDSGGRGIWSGLHARDNGAGLPEQ